MSLGRKDDNQLVTASEIARLAGVSPSAVSNWRKRFADFPSPAGEAATGGDLFDRAEIDEWLRRHNRAQQSARSTADQLWAVMDRLRGRIGDPAALVSAGAALTRLAPPEAGAAATPDWWLRWMERAVAQVRGERPELGRVFEPLADLAPNELQSLVDALANVESRRLPDILDRVIDRSQRYGEFQFRTPPETTDLLMDLADPRGTVFDPAVGSAEFLIRAAQRRDAKEFFGQELNEDAWRIAVSRLLVRGLRAEVALGDSLFEDAWPDLRADLVLCDPPAGVRLSDSQRSVGDPRWRLLGSVDAPPSSAADFAWIAHVIHHLAPAGRGYLLLPPGALFRGGAEARFRGELLRQGTVEAVISLPSPQGSLGASTIWIVRTPASDPQDVLVINAQDGERALSKQLAARVRETVEMFRRNPNGFDPIPGFAVGLPVLQLLAGDASLVPSRWVSVRRDPSALIDALEKATRQLATAHAIVPDNPPELTIHPVEGEPERFRLGDLIEARLVQLIRPARLTRDDYVDEGIPLWEPADVRTPWNREEQSRFADPEQLDPRSITEPGDVVITTVGELRARVDTEGGHALGTSLHAIRLLTDMFDPFAVAALLGSAQNRGMMTGTTIPRVNVRELEIPRLDAVTAARLRQTLAELEAEEGAARSTADAAAEARTALIDAVAAGAAIIGEPPPPKRTRPKGTNR